MSGNNVVQFNNKSEKNEKLMAILQKHQQNICKQDLNI